MSGPQTHLQTFLSSEHHLWGYFAWLYCLWTCKSCENEQNKSAVVWRHQLHQRQHAFIMLCTHYWLSVVVTWNKSCWQVDLFKPKCQDSNVILFLCKHKRTNNLFLNYVFWATVSCASSIIISSITSIDVILNFHKTQGFLKEYQYRTKMPQPIVFILPCHLNTDPLVCTKGSVQCFIRRRCKASFRGWVLLICDPPINPRSTPWKFYRARSNLFQSLYHKMHSAKKKN